MNEAAKEGIIMLLILVAILPFFGVVILHIWDGRWKRHKGYLVSYENRLVSGREGFRAWAGCTDDDDGDQKLPVFPPGHVSFPADPVRP